MSSHFNNIRLFLTQAVAADVVKNDLKNKKITSFKNPGVRVGRKGNVVRDPNMKKLQQQANRIRKQEKKNIGRSNNGKAQPVVDAVMKRAAQARKKIQQTKSARQSKVAQSRGLGAPQQKSAQPNQKNKMVRLTPQNRQPNKSFVFRGNNQAQQQAQSNRRGNGKRGAGAGFRVVVNQNPGNVMNRGRGRGRGRGYGNQMAQRQQAQLQQRRAQGVQVRQQRINQMRGLVQPFSPAAASVMRVGAQPFRGRGGYPRGGYASRGRGGANRGGAGVIRIVRR